MTDNGRYAALYADDTLGGFLPGYRAAMADAEKAWAARMVAEAKRRKPRGKNPQWPDQNDPFTVALRTELLATYRVEELRSERRRLDESRQSELATLARAVVFAPGGGMTVVQRSYTATYRTQGYGMHKYARTASEPLKARLESFGISAEIKFELHAKASGQFSCGDDGVYELWADCPAWMADAAERTMTLGEEFDALTAAGTNYRVYNPLISWETIDILTARKRA